MYGPAKYAILILGAAVLAYLLTPLAVLFIEVVENPNAIGLEIIPLEVFTNQSALVEVVYKHNISISFNNLTIVLAGKTISFGDVKQGTYAKNITLSISSLQEMSETRISFVLAGIYPVSIEVKRT
ncbi:MAG TPA: hypothetical protein ENO36_04850 [Fervidicoccus fontis]|uniref:Uncharacterized protein n=1 Tax=Fervidicoccus fontis TaxID=683846 RepID=A0A7C2UK00_9CREN|nr:hypothetical protein [Fervidicoccus fontis]